MSTIVFRNGIMATDSRAYAGDKNPMGAKNKLHVLSNGALLGSSSRDVGKTDAFAAWCQEAIDEGIYLPDHSDKELIGVQALLVWPDGTVHYWHNSSCFSGPLEAEFFAIGSGQEYALGALHMGASAEQAIQVAIECDVWSGGPIRTAKLKKKRKK